jgi:hypothetical protein
MRDSIKAMGLVGMGLFLYSHFFRGTLLFYINERFVWLTFLACDSVYHCWGQLSLPARSRTLA